MKRKATLTALTLAAITAAGLSTALQAQPMNGPMGGPMGGPGMHHPMGPKIDFKAIDTNGDGAISMDELKAWEAKQMEGLGSDANGALTEQDIVNFETAKAKARIEARVSAWFKAADVNGDGKVSAAEMMMAPRNVMADRMFEMADVNHDGKVTQAEFDAARAKMMERMKMMREHRGHEGRGHHKHHGWKKGDHGPMGQQMTPPDGQTPPPPAPPAAPKDSN